MLRLFILMCLHNFKKELVMKSIFTMIFLIMSVGIIQASEKKNCLFAYSKFKALVKTCKNPHTNGFYSDNSPDSIRRSCIEQYHKQFMNECNAESDQKKLKSFLLN